MRGKLFQSVASARIAGATRDSRTLKMEDKTRRELIEEIAALKNTIRNLERSEAMRRLGEAGLQQEHALFLDMINAQPAGIYRIRVFPRRKWRKEAWNIPQAAPYSVELASERFCEILGIAREVFEHTPGIVEELVHPEDKAEFVRKNMEANEKLIPFQWEGRLCIGERVIWAHFESLPRLIADGDVLWTGFLHDVTNRKIAEAALVRSEASLRKEQNFNHLLLNNTSALIVAMDLDAKTLMMNQALLNALEYTEDEGPRVEYLTTFVPEADREIVAAVFRKIVHAGMATVNENRIVSKSGRTYLVEWHGGIAKREAGEPGFFVGVGIDITGRKQAEQKLHDSEERLKLLSDHLPGGLDLPGGYRGERRRAPPHLHQRGRRGAARRLRRARASRRVLHLRPDGSGGRQARGRARRQGDRRHGPVRRGSARAPAVGEAPAAFHVGAAPGGKRPPHLGRHRDRYQQKHAGPRGRKEEPELNGLRPSRPPPAGREKIDRVPAPTRVSRPCFRRMFSPLTRMMVPVNSP